MREGLLAIAILGLPGTFISPIQDGIAKIEIKENTQDGDDVAYDNLYFVR